MKSTLCLVLLLASPSLVFAQEHKSPKWAVGAEFGYAAVNLQIYYDLPYILAPNEVAVLGDPLGDSNGGEGIVAFHAGKMMNRFLRADALVSMNLVGVTGSHVVLTSEGSRTTGQFDKGTGSGYVTTGMRFVAENAGSHSVIRPRASLSAVWQWTKGPGGMLSAGFTMGSAKTRFAVDAGEQVSWLRYDQLFRTVQTSNNALISEQRLNGTKRLHGFAVRIGFDHYVF